MTEPIIEQRTPKIRVAVASLVVAASTLVGIAVNEGYSSKAYYDSGHVATDGFGQADGVKITDTTTPVRALVQLNNSVSTYAQGVRNCIHVPLFQYEFDSYVDTAYNVGVNAFCKSPIAAKANQMDYQGACNAMLGWYVHDHQGHLIAGLVKRRQKEYLTCMGQS